MDLKEILEKSNLTMYGLAKRTGLGTTTIHDICTGKRKDIDLSTGIKIAKALNVPITQIQDCIKGVEDES